MAQVSTGNLPIPNDTGANVLADINENLLALQSNNAYSSPPPVAKANQFWIDTSTTPDTLKIRGNADNAAFITLGNIETNMGMMPKTGGVFEGNIRSAAGSEVSPAVQMGASNLGFYKNATNSIGATVNGSLRLSLNIDGLMIHGQNNQTKALYLNDADNTAHVAIRAPNTLSTNWGLTLPENDGNAGEVLKTDGNGVTDWVAISTVPIGAIFPYAGSQDALPSGYLECDGSQKPSATYPQLSSLLGATFNKGQTPASGQFFLPDLRGRFVRGWDHGANIDKTSNRTRGSEQGDRNKRHTHSSQHSATTTGGSHTHNIRGLALQPSEAFVGITLGSGQGYQIGYRTNDGVLTSNPIKHSGNLSLSTSINLTINNDPFNTGDDESRPINIALIYIIKAG